LVAQGEQVCRMQTGLAGSVHCASEQQSPLTHRPRQQTSSFRQGFSSSHVGQQPVPLSQPESSVDPSGIVVRQKMAVPALAPASPAPVRSASTKQVRSRLALRKSALVRTAPEKLARPRLAPRKLAPARFCPS
jgi:hypothetical protein